MTYQNGRYYIRENEWDEFVSTCKEYGFSHGRRHGVRPDVFRSGGKGGTLRISTDEGCSFYRMIEFWSYDGIACKSSEEVAKLVADLIEHGFVEQYVSVGSRGFRTEGFIKCDNGRF